ncbi:50S ribosomal protein L5 [Patescibacteria group bacterium]|nr:50S ribosomal protein L5 [Patescibacteria group bacterium]
MAKKSENKGLKEKYLKEVIPQLQKELGIKNIHALPKIEKVKINIGIGTYVKTHNKDYSNVVDNLAAIAGQAPVINKARMSVSNFKIREGDAVGLSVTVRGQRMYDFLTKLINVVFPRVRDFRGISPKSFDGNGNYSLGFKEHTVFPEISPDEVSKLHGVQVSISTTAKNNEEGFALLSALGFPFKKN